MKKLILLTILFLILIVPQCVKGFELPFNLSGFYLNGNVFCNFAKREKHQNSKATLNPGIFVAPAVGYQFCNGLRVEGEFGYRYNDLKRLKFYGTSFCLHGHLETFSGLANVYYDIPLCWCLKPYIGGGIGYGYSKIRMRQGNFACTRHNCGFAWQVMAGIAYPVCDNVDFAMEYRFFRNERISCFQNHDIGGGLRYYF